MNIMRGLSLIAAITVGGFAACNYSPDCWYYGEGSENAGVGPGAGPGGGVIIPTGPAGVGGYGDAPPKRPQDATNRKLKCNSDETDEIETEAEKPTENACTAGGTVNDGTTYNICSDACKTPCGGVNGFSASAFEFKTIIPDDGTGQSGGWQEASVVLRVKRWTSVFPETWECPQMTFGTPLRNIAQGKISAQMAASVAAEVATEASHELKEVEERGIYCFKMKEALKVRFPQKIIGAKVTQP